MEPQRRWIAFDTFKLIVGLVLLLLMLFLTLLKPAAAPPASAGQGTQIGVIASTQTPLSSTNTAAPLTAASTVASSLTPTTVLPTATPTLPSSQTPTAVLPTTVLPTATTPPQPELTPTVSSLTATPAATTQPEPSATPQTALTATTQPQAASVDCPLAQPSRLAVGKQALVIMNLNLRQEAGLNSPIIRVGLPNTNVEIIGGPVCTPYQNGAYLWWNVKSPDGQTGWSAEASLSKNVYFLQPVP